MNKTVVYVICRRWAKNKNKTADVKNRFQASPLDGKVSAMKIQNE